MTPDYVICADCESPCYTFEWREDKVVEALCEVCANEDPLTFLTEDEYDTYANSGDWRDYVKR